MKSNNKDNQNILPLNNEKSDELLFVHGELNDNQDGYEVYIKHKREHIGAIHYSRNTGSYSYHPDGNKYVFYTPKMLKDLQKIVTNAIEKKRWMTYKYYHNRQIWN